MSESIVDLIVPVRDRWDLTRACLESIRAHTEPGYRVIVVDNASADDTRMLATSPLADVVLRNETPRNFAASINQAIQASTAPYVCVLNNDVVVGPKWLSSLLAVFAEAKDSLGAVGPITSNARDWQGLHYLKTQWQLDLPVDHIPAERCEEWMRYLRFRFRRSHLEIDGMLAFFCTLMRRAAIDAVGNLDEEFDFGGEDDDYCYRLQRAGFSLALSLHSYVVHHGGVSEGPLPVAASDRYRRNTARLVEKWPERYGARAS